MDVASALDRAIWLARQAPDPRPNPRVGCVLLDDSGTVIGEAGHAGPGLPHAEVGALEQAGARAAGATAVVTLEPCNHHGRTGPCSQALIDAGVAEVHYGQLDPNPHAAGGTDALRDAGIRVECLESAAAEAVNPHWNFAMRHSRPFVIWKVGATLDGRVAAFDGTSRWITSPEARADTHRLRSEVDAVLLGTGTVRRDDPQLTAREPGARQPLRVAVGLAEVPMSANIRTAEPESAFRHLRTRDALGVLRTLLEEHVHYVMLEGGPRLAAAFVTAGLVDAIRWYCAPKLLGAGTPSLADIGVGSIDGALEWQVTAIAQVGADVRIDLTKPASGS